ncbi:MAG: hypothetical protein K9N06_12240 [Candidatus Cloacimonetes bacterium]|nr:hypothetical protein [Candidatus Cloacimonadota bacterium]
MKQRIFLIFALCSISIQLFSYLDYACPFLVFNQSLSNAAFGLESGTADIRHLDASSFVNNPAKLGLIRDFTANYSKSDYYFAKYNLMKIAFKFMGFGVSLPMYNFENFDFEGRDFGYSVQYPSQESYNEESSYHSTFTPIENVLSLSTGFDVFTLFPEEKLYPESYAVYLGSSIHLIKSQLAPHIGSVESSAMGFGNCLAYDIGSLVTYKPLSLQKQDSKWLFALGIKYAFGNNLTYINEEQSDQIPQYFSIGLSSDYAAYGMHTYFKENREKYHIYSSIDIRKYSIDRCVIGSGIELGWQDLFSYRLGGTYYSDTEKYGLSYSLGFNIDLNNGNGFSINYLSMLLDNDIGYRDRLDFSIKFVY